MISGDLDFGDDDTPAPPAPPTRAVGRTSPHPTAMPPRGSTLQPPARGAPSSSSSKPVTSHPTAMPPRGSTLQPPARGAPSSSSSKAVTSHPLGLSGASDDSVDLGEVSFGSSLDAEHSSSSSRGRSGAVRAGVRGAGSSGGVRAAPLAAASRGAATRGPPSAPRKSYDSDDIQFSGDDSDGDSGSGGRGRPQAGHGGQAVGRPASALGRHSISHTPSFSSGGELSVCLGPVW